jgi:formylglycine-generating enzyme required for sulfatase activity
MDSQEKLNQLFQKAREEQPQLSFEATKEKLVTSLNDSKGNWIKRLLTFKNCVIMLTSILSLVTVFYIGTGTTSNIKTTKIEEKIIIEEESSSITKKKIEEKQKQKEAEDFAKVELNQEDSIGNVTTVSKPKGINLKPINLVYHPLHPNDLLVKSDSTEDESILVLTDEEIKENDKQKKKMLKALAKLKLEDYVFIPSGTMFYEGSTKSFQAFYMQTTEVSNLEYRTFLNDLIIHNRYEEYQIAKVDSDKWVELYGGNTIYTSTMKSKNNWNDSIYRNLHFMSNYFNHPAYNNYPVCNISREGAELYCSWLQEEFKKVYAFKNEERYENLIRLPSRAEWCYAASNGKDNQVYPWGTDSITNSKGEVLANKKSIPKLDSINNEPKNTTKNSNILTGVILNNIVTGFPKSIHQFKQTPNGIYNISGNIAEMVYEDYNSKARCGTAGGSWESNAEEIKIFGPDPYAGITTPHPAIGFRVCFIYRKGL